MANVFIKGKFENWEKWKCSVCLDDFPEEYEMGLKLTTSKRQIIVKLTEMELRHLGLIFNGGKPILPEDDSDL